MCRTLRKPHHRFDLGVAGPPESPQIRMRRAILCSLSPAVPASKRFMRAGVVRILLMPLFGPVSLNLKSSLETILWICLSLSQSPIV